MNTFKSFALNVLFLFSATFSPTVSAQLINFDALGQDSAAINNGYAGFNWSNFTSMNGTFVPNSGFERGVVSGPNIAYNQDGLAASFSRETAFTLRDMYVTKGLTAGITHFEGYIGNTLTFSRSVFSSTAAPSHIVFDWVGITKLKFFGEPGTSETVIDNIHVAAVPEPETYALMGLGLLAVIVAKRRKRV
ncbi:PEP-CTERM sorting domain-containing protein [Iodobacter arcticus]|uniref:PEP-CTERM sorting domain-containing protein n=1 Tax=Iodobacter arcticus TaxID=590593 RepID=A0ABW2R3C6_9NEIS